MEMTSIKTIVETIMDRKGLTRLEFANLYRLSPSQVTRWLNSNQQPKTEIYLRLKEVYDEIKDTQMSIFKEIS